MAKKKMSPLDWIAIVLIIIGALNWGLVALNFNLVEAILGTGTITKLIYGLVGISAVYSIIKLASIR